MNLLNRILSFFQGKKVRKIIIYRCLPFSKWHAPYEKTGSEWLDGMKRKECSCPYGKHIDTSFCWSYRDPLNIEDIIKIEQGTPILIWVKKFENEEMIICGRFANFKIKNDDDLENLPQIYMRIYGIPEIKFSEVRHIAILPKETKPYIRTLKKCKKDSGLEIFIEDLSNIYRRPSKEIKLAIENLKNAEIPNKKIDLH